MSIFKLGGIGKHYITSISDMLEMNLGVIGPTP